MNDSSFDLITQEVLKQQHLMEKLEAENCELRRQLADLRAGHGIMLDIGGKRFALSHDLPATTSTTEAPKTPQKTISSPQTPSAVEQPAAEKPAATETKAAEKQPAEVPTFLEEIMIDEFSTAMTTPMAVWKKPAKKQNEEEQKAALRRELMGSYLLE